MRFNSPAFIFLFLPIVLLGFFSLGKRGFQKSAVTWLVFSSLFFYGWWNPAYLWLLIFS
ncbi:MAG: MBOAT family protein, partial [Planctomycetota bacterium]|nr:MBOAT family protein [Planctomycetota bacterium]